MTDALASDPNRRSTLRWAGLVRVGFLSIATVALLILTPGCHLNRPKPPSGPLPGLAFDPSSKAAKRAAMLSVYFYSSYDTANWMPEAFRPITLDDAVNILASDSGEISEARRRRAIVKLGAAPPTNRRLRALEGLDAPLGEINAALDQAIESTLAERETIIRALLQRLLGPAFSACWTKVEPTVVTFDADMTSHVKATVHVSRKVNELRPVLDPQNWDVCSDWFEKAYAAQKVGSDYPNNSSGDVSEDTVNAPNPGSAYSDLKLFEYFAMSWGPVNPSWVKNLLNITSIMSPMSAPAPWHVVKYDLFRSIKSQVLYYPKNGGVLTDGGDVRADEDTITGWSTVVGTKAFKLGGFSQYDWWLNFWTGMALHVMGDEMEGAVCCNPH